MAAVVIASRRRNRRIQIMRPFPFRGNPFDLNEVKFISKFRLSKEAVENLCSELHPVLNKATRGYSVEMQVLSSLRLLGTGSFQNVLSDDIFVHSSQATVSRVFKKFLDAMIRLAPKYIKFPTEPSSIAATKLKFYNVAGFPGVIGAIDETNIPLLKPSCPEWFNYVKSTANFFKKICDAENMITNVVANWPGSTHDAFIWSQCGIRNIMTNLPPNTYLVGDSGYPIQPWLMTPYTGDCAPFQERYNIKHRKTMCVIERTFGQIKSRFRCLHETGGTLLYLPEKVLKIIVVCAVLHNICVMEQVPLPDCIDDEEDDDDDALPPNVSNDALRREGQRIRDALARSF